jgi:hypothetical protein
MENQNEEEVQSGDSQEEGQVIEVTKTVTERLSKNELRDRKLYLEETIARYQSELEQVKESLKMFDGE